MNLHFFQKSLNRRRKSFSVQRGHFYWNFFSPHERNKSWKSNEDSSCPPSDSCLTSWCVGWLPLRKSRIAPQQQRHLVCSPNKTVKLGRLSIRAGMGFRFWARVGLGLRQIQLEPVWLLVILLNNWYIYGTNGFARSLISGFETGFMMSRPR